MFTLLEEIESEIYKLDSYLDFGHENLNNFGKTIQTILDDDIKNLRKAENIPDETGDDEIIIRGATLDLEFTENFSGSPWIRIADFFVGMDVVNEYSEFFYATIVIMHFSIIERSLVKLQNLHDSEESKKSNFKQGAIYRVRSFLEDKFNYKIDYAYWEELVMINKLRNTIVHSGFVFELDEFFRHNVDPKLINYLKLKKIYIELGKISISFTYCKYLAEFSQNLFKKIIQELHETGKSLK